MRKRTLGGVTTYEMYDPRLDINPRLIEGGKEIAVYDSSGNLIKTKQFDFETRNPAKKSKGDF